MRPLRWCGFSLLTLVPLAALAIGLVFVKLHHGAIPLRFAVEPIRRAIAAELEGVRIAVGDAALHLAKGGALEVRLHGVDLASASGQPLASAKEAIVNLDMATLWSGVVAPSRIVLIGPRIAIDTGASALAPSERPVPSPDRPGTSGPGSPPGEGAAGPADRGVGGLDSANDKFTRGILAFVAQLRQSAGVASHIRSVGVENAVVAISDGGEKSTWLVPRFELMLPPPTGEAVVSGRGEVASADRPWSLAFEIKTAAGNQGVRVTTRVGDLVPRALAGNLPHKVGLAAIDVPLSVASQSEFNASGNLISSRAEINLGTGRFLLAGVDGLPLAVDGGKLSLHWDGAKDRLLLAPSTVDIDGGRLVIAGALTRIRDNEGHRGFEIDLWAPQGSTAGYRRGKLLDIERLAFKSRVWPDEDRAELVGFSFKAGGADIAASGSLDSRPDGRGTRIDGRIGPMDVAAIKALWPTGVSPSLRAQVMERVVAGKLAGGTFAIRSGGKGGPGGAGDETSHSRLTLEWNEVAVAVAAGTAPLTVPRALMHIIGDTLQLDVPEAGLIASDGKRLAVKAARITVEGVDQDRPTAQIVAHATGPVSAAVELASAPSIGAIKPGVIPSRLSGKFDAQWSLRLPIGGAVTMSDVNVEGRIQITDGRMSDAFGPHDITGANFTVGVTEKAVDVKGQLLLAGVLAMASGQWILGEARDRQPPLSITARLDKNDRRQLGIDLDNLLQGEVPIEVLVTPTGADNGTVQVSADLTGAELMIQGIGWSKPAGRAAKATFDVAKHKSGKGLELRSFKIAGDSITLDGTVSIGPDNKTQSFNFPGFSLNVVTNLHVQGQKRPDGIWAIMARGATFDATDLIRNNYAVGGNRDTPSRKSHGGGYDLDAKIDTVLGMNEISLQTVRITKSERAEELTSLDMKSSMAGGGSLALFMPQQKRGTPRVIEAQTDDAGQALRLIGLYTNMNGGQASLRLNLDARGAAERSGQFNIRKFRVLGDSVVYEVLQSADDTRPAIAAANTRRGSRIVREEIYFDELRSSFSSGNGQIALENFGATGPLVGVSLRGKVDFRSRRLALGGTYVPLSGLNRALSGIPLLRELFTGPKGDGVFGITFGVTGPMSEPQVIVNPFSMVAPGVLREIFQMVPDNPQVTPTVEPRRPPARESTRVRESPPVTAGPAGTSGGVSITNPQVLDGWSSKATRSN